MSAHELITEHLDLWTQAVTKKSTAGRGRNGKVELTGIKKLRELILELALSGKLVEAEESDKPAHHLLSRIELEKSRLAGEKVIKKPKKLEATSGEEPYQIPSHWCWVCLGQVTNYGVTDKAEPNQVADNTWVLELEDIEKESSKLLNKVRYTERQFKSSKNRFERGDVLYGKLRPYLDKVLVADEPGVCTTEIIPIRGYLGLLPEFLRLVLKSPSFRRYANDSTHGMNLPRLGTDKARLAMIPLAPEQEQHRIVQKVDELMALCDRLEQQTSDQLDAHETLVDTLLGSLTQSANTTELVDNWARFTEHFDTLFATEQSIDKLKQTILQLAVMGRLVEQDAGDEPVDVLFSQIWTHQHDRYQLKEIQKPKQIKVSDSLDIEPPLSWRKALLNDLAFVTKLAGFEYTKHLNLQDEGEVPVIRAQNVRSFKPDTSNLKYIDLDTSLQLQRSAIDRTCLLITFIGAGIGDVCTMAVGDDERWHLAPNVAKVEPFGNINPRFINIFLCSPSGQKELFKSVKSTAQPSLSMTTIREIWIPIPPLAEQHRIVQKVDELTALCDHLKQRLNQASNTRCQLAGAVVEGALN